jgi:A/G-specific adenine glycosylase
VRRGTAWFAVNERGEVLLRRRSESGLLGGMMEVPSSPWRERAKPEILSPPFTAPWQVMDAPVVHVFTHFRLELEVAWARIPATDGAKLAADGVWAAPDELPRYALPTVMKKVCSAGFTALKAGPSGGRRKGKGK